jgi:AcrR family transcriptional regulator
MVAAWNDVDVSGADGNGEPDGRGRSSYHHGNLRETLVRAALGMITERGLAGFALAELARAVGVSQAAPYRHFRDRNALLAEVARRGFDQLAAELDAAQRSAPADPVAGLERCAQAHLAFAGRKPAEYAAMFETGFSVTRYPELQRARAGAFAVVRQAAQAACDRSQAPRRPPPAMVALHVWSLAHGIADLYVSHDGDGHERLPMPPEELLEAGLLIYLQSLGLAAAPAG